MDLAEESEFCEILQWTPNTVDPVIPDGEGFEGRYDVSTDRSPSRCAGTELVRDDFGGGEETLQFRGVDDGGVAGEDPSNQEEFHNLWCGTDCQIFGLVQP